MVFLFYLIAFLVITLLVFPVSILLKSCQGNSVDTDKRLSRIYGSGTGSENKPFFS